MFLLGMVLGNQKSGGMDAKLVDELRNEPILLAHHPLCGRFDDHLLTIGGRRWCLGCLTVYPTALTVLLLSMLIQPPTFEQAFVLAVLLLAAQSIRFVLPKERWTSIILNMVLGTSLAMTALSLWTCPPELVLFVYPFILIVASIFLYLKGRRVLTQCRVCPYHAQFPGCARGGMRLPMENNGK